MALYHLPEAYKARDAVSYFSDIEPAQGEPVYQPEVYEVADYFLRKTNRSTAIDFGCGMGGKLVTLPASRRIGIDFGSNIDYCRTHHLEAGEWIEANFSEAGSIALADLSGPDCVVICADVVEHLLDPSPLLQILAECHARGAIVLTSTPDRIRAWGEDHDGPPPNPSHVREWALQEYRSLLEDNGLPCVYAGYTFNNDRDLKLETIITIHDKTAESEPAGNSPQLVRPLAILALYNEADCIEQVVRDWIAQGCDVYAIDNWSSDPSWDILNRLAAEAPDRIKVERFPEHPGPHYEWRDILRHKEMIAATHPGRWIIHTDADELRRSPFPGLPIDRALQIAQNAGANRINFTLINFRPTPEHSDLSLDLDASGSYFEFASKPDEFDQAKAWLQPEQKVDLVSSGGHVATFDDAVEFPYRFLLKHFPIRSPEHGRRKVMTERKGRWSPEERAMGWHIQYDGYHAGSRYLWNSTDLLQFTDAFWKDHGLAVITDIAMDGLRGRSQADAPSALPTASVEEVADHLVVLKVRTDAIERNSASLLIEQRKHEADVERLIRQIRQAQEDQLVTIAENWARERNAHNHVIETLTNRILALEEALTSIRNDMTARDQTLNQRYRTAIRRQHF
jgi:SAM-dependent methyltransferase